MMHVLGVGEITGVRHSTNLLEHKRVTYTKMQTKGLV